MTRKLNIVLFLSLSIIFSGCGSPRILQGDINASVTIDGITRQTSLTAGSTVQSALESLVIELGSLDRVEPPLYTVLTEGIAIKVIPVW